MTDEYEDYDDCTEDVGTGGPVISLREAVGRGYDEFMTCRKFYRMVKGSKGSKKSRTAALWYIYNMMKYPDANTLVIKKTYRSMEHSIFAEMQWAIDKLGVSRYWKVLTSPLELTYIPTGQKILFYGMDDPMKLASVTVSKGYLCWVLFEEFSDITSEEDFIRIVMSIRGEIPPETGLFKQITGIFNPWTDQSWIKARFFDTPHDDVLAMTTTFRDNEFLSKTSDIPRYMELYKTNPRLAKVICDGEWGVASGLIYENWETADFDPLQVLAEHPNAVCAYGLDFGYKQSYDAFAAVIIDVGARTLWVCDELYKRGLSNIDLAKRLTEMGYAKETIWADSAEPKSIYELMMGIPENAVDPAGNPTIRTYSLPNIKPALKGPGTVSNGIQRLQGYHMIISSHCPNTQMELRSYAYALDKNGKPTGDPIKEFDHIMDAIRYATTKIFIRGHGKVAEAKGNDSLVLPKSQTIKTRRSKRVVSSI